MKKVVSLVFLAGLFTLCTAVICLGGQNAGHVLDAPIIEGKSAGGVSIGQTLDQVVASMGKKPDMTEQPPGSSQKMLIYQLAPMTTDQITALIITMNNGKVFSIEISDQVTPGRAYSYKGKSSKGFLLGDNLGRVTGLYGKPSIMLGAQGYWYRDLGIAFFCIGTEAERVPNSVVILAPGSDLPEYLKLSGTH
ncbi:MAG: hypothetical protein OEV28_08890 [Nitrospirota bacterium]|nr:hypothetical protein [Nitrospirota bacterium]